MFLDIGATYANVTSTLALVVALGGATAFAATNLPKNSVGPRQLKPKAVKTGYLARNAVRTGKLAPESAKAGKIAKRAITTDRLRDNSVTGAKVREETLGPVPFATGAGNAQTVGSLSAAQLIGAAKPRCPAGTTLSTGVCIEIAARPDTPYNEAIEACAIADRRLPTETELFAYKRRIFTGATQELEWSANGRFLYEGSSYAPFTRAVAGGKLDTAYAAITFPNEFRCVTPPS